MNTKMPAPIEKLMLNAATFHGISVVPTLITFSMATTARERSCANEVI